MSLEDSNRCWTLVASCRIRVFVISNPVLHMEVTGDRIPTEDVLPLAFTASWTSNCHRAAVSVDADFGIGFF
jgi:hypothetical protein